MYRALCSVKVDDIILPSKDQDLNQLDCISHKFWLGVDRDAPWKEEIVFGVGVWDGGSGG